MSPSITSESGTSVRELPSMIKFHGASFWGSFL